MQYAPNHLSPAHPGEPESPALPRPSPRAIAELRGQFESAVDFADLCAFLSAGTSSERASQLVDVARSLLEETIDSLVDGGGTSRGRVRPG